LLPVTKIQKNMNSTNSIPDMSYFRLSLVDFLRESHPERLNDVRFIAARAEAAAEIYATAVLNGSNGIEAGEQAHCVLFQGLYFSKHDTLVHILRNEFSNEIPEYGTQTAAIRLLPECESVFAKYSLSDGFAYEPEYGLLCTELTGVIALYLESHGLQ
jgi:hypothetical protein